MGKIVKPFVIIQFIFTIALLGMVLWFHYFSPDNTMQNVKRQDIILEDIMKDLSASLKMTDVDQKAIADNSQPVSPEDFQKASTVLATMEMYAKTKHETILNAQHVLQLADAKNQEYVARNDVETNELARNQSEVAQREQEERDAKTALAAARNTVRQLQGEVAALESQIEGMKSEIAESESEAEKLEGELEVKIAELTRVKKLLDACIRGEQKPQVSEWSGVKAKILEVDADWQFAIINKGEVDALPMFLTAFVHRGDKFLAMATVVRVEENVALIKIDLESLMTDDKIVAGDTIFFY